MSELLLLMGVLFSIVEEPVLLRPIMGFLYSGNLMHRIYPLFDTQKEQRKLK
uniref:Uncharacterized protein n=1 Tax=Candidatus Kentrum sp. TUN TaxID=2126343 RepID=A0A450ZQT2_9GAMM|nr:MAG: hypothetical protein BECKTUN1418D_GA0071000_103412 [Candidatus Kentron sp. TUN]VFK56195.1 MAG: hypothetical protein BECKTUN1418F_GA0071002_10824 [Candidatus Kentron sp. TUN]VFK62434.1 MAG: hypothetical protein BECKTUN1418E_GA0071001_10804 [Candidatus Kentron sp. TUN]